MAGFLLDLGLRRDQLLDSHVKSQAYSRWSLANTAFGARVLVRLCRSGVGITASRSKDS
jgi:hypothetical protein